MKTLTRILYFTFCENLKRIPIVINPLDLDWKYIKGGGPGG
jgi:hypothetical protein